MCECVSPSSFRWHYDGWGRCSLFSSAAGLQAFSSPCRLESTLSCSRLMLLRSGLRAPAVATLVLLQADAFASCTFLPDRLWWPCHVLGDCSFLICSSCCGVIGWTKCSYKASIDGPCEEFKVLHCNTAGCPCGNGVWQISVACSSFAQEPSRALVVTRHFFLLIGRGTFPLLLSSMLYLEGFFPP